MSELCLGGFIKALLNGWILFVWQHFLKKIMSYKLIGGVAIFLYAQGSLAQGINVGAMHDYMQEGQTQILKRVRNFSDSTALIRVEVFELTFDGNKEVEHAPVVGNGMGVFCQNDFISNDLVASPSRLIIPAKGQQATRLIFCGGREKERYYRIRFVPALPEQVYDFPLTTNEKEKYTNNITAGVKVLTGFGTIVFIRPSKPFYQTLITPQSSSIKIKNQGNSVVIIDEYITCDNNHPNKCISGRKYHIRPGMEKDIAHEAGERISFRLVEGSKMTEMAF